MLRIRYRVRALSSKRSFPLLLSFDDTRENYMSVFRGRLNKKKIIISLFARVSCKLKTYRLFHAKCAITRDDDT